MREIVKVPGHNPFIIKHLHGLSPSNKEEVFRWEAACSCGWRSGQKVFKRKTQTHFNDHKRKFSCSYMGVEHPLKSEIISFALNGGRPKAFGKLDAKMTSRKFAAYGFRLEYLTQEELSWVMANRKAKGLIK